LRFAAKFCAISSIESILSDTADMEFAIVYASFLAVFASSAAYSAVWISVLIDVICYLILSTSF